MHSYIAFCYRHKPKTDKNEDELRWREVRKKNYGKWKKKVMVTMNDD